MGLGFLIALLVAENTPLRRFTRAVVFAPVVIGLGASSLLWYWLFSYDFGLINRAAARPRDHRQAGALVRRRRRRRALGGHRVDRLEGARLRHAPVRRRHPGDPRRGHRRRKVDGASYWQRVRQITLPLTARTILLVTLVSVIGSLLAFDQFYIMTAGQPRNMTATSVFFIYLNSFPYLKLGYGAALSLILAGIILVFTIVQIALTRRSHA